MNVNHLLYFRLREHNDHIGELLEMTLFTNFVMSQPKDSFIWQDLSNNITKETCSTNLFNFIESEYKVRNLRSRTKSRPYWDIYQFRKKNFKNLLTNQDPDIKFRTHNAKERLFNGCLQVF